jgi:hypothetical protein
LSIPHDLKCADRIVSICKKLNANNYINNKSGAHLYDQNYFASKNIRLQFFEADVPPYKQPSKIFTPNLSIIDIMMNLDLDTIKYMLAKGHAT